MKTVIYEPKGKAGEYADGYALNIYKGCTHGCTYCYNMTGRTYVKPEDYIKECNPRKDVINKLREEAHLFAGKTVFLSFLSDPYQEAEKGLCLTRQALEIFKEHNIRPNILTKSPLIERDFDLLVELDAKVGTTLTAFSEALIAKYEPNAPHTLKRMEMLSNAKKRGLETWISLEPVIDPEEAYRIIEATSEFCGYYKVGKWNYDKEANKIDWKLFHDTVVELLKQYDKEFYIKDDLKKFAEK